MSLLSVLCCQVSATGWSLVQRSPADCGVSECDREALTMRRPWPTISCNVKQSLYRPGEALRVPAGWSSQISRQPANEGCRVVRPRHRPPLPSGNIPGTHFCYTPSRPRSRTRPGELSQWNVTIGKGTRDLPACSAVPQPTASSREGLLSHKKILSTSKSKITFIHTYSLLCGYP